MPYGSKKHRKSAGEFTLGDVGGFALSGAFGIVAAIATDYQQRGEASALFTINRWVVEFGRMFALGDVPLWTVMAGLVGIGALSVFYLQPTTRQGAFAQGYGLLAALMMAAPPDIAGAMPGATHDSFVSAPVRTGIELASLRSVQDVKADVVDVHLTVHFPNGLRDDVQQMISKGALRGRLRNETSGQTYNLFRSAGSEMQMQGNVLIVHAGVPAGGAEGADLRLRIEAAGYAIEEQSAQARGDQPLGWRIDMRPSQTPLFLQRLGKSYWY